MENEKPYREAVLSKGICFELEYLHTFAHCGLEKHLGPNFSQDSFFFLVEKLIWFWDIFKKKMWIIAPLAV